MKYNRITYKFDKKNERYRFFYEAEYIDKRGSQHLCSGNYFDVYQVTGHYVAIQYSTNPVICCDSMNELCRLVESTSGCKPELVE